MSYTRGWVSKEVGAMMKTLLITGSIALVLALCGVLLTVFGPETPAAEYEYLKFAVMLIMFLVILIGSYWFVMVPSGRNGERENPTGGTDDEGGTPEP
jgi:nitrogen fixation/metabolism regulation signal transduction histidine kinase